MGNFNRHDNLSKAQTIARAAERKAKHDAPQAARVCFDPQTFGPRPIVTWRIRPDQWRADRLA